MLSGAYRQFNILRRLFLSSVVCILTCSTVAPGTIVFAGSSPDLASDSAPPAVPVIFDTDIGNDVDDVLAMGVIHSLETRGVLRLCAVTITKDHPQCAPFVDAVNTFYGRGDI
ncbi:MAG: hypothetical protein ACK58T_00100, partial [Phycisphaerae bacterium]